MATRINFPTYSLCVTQSIGWIKTKFKVFEVITVTELGTGVKVELFKYNILYLERIEKV